VAKSNPQKDRKDFGVGTYWGVVYQFITVNLRIEVYTSLSPKKMESDFMQFYYSIFGS